MIFHTPMLLEYRSGIYKDNTNTKQMHSKTRRCANK
jgi:hypothetical protein